VIENMPLRWVSRKNKSVKTTSYAIKNGFYRGAIVESVGQLQRLPNGY
jgi:hypothetical protein